MRKGILSLSSLGRKKPGKKTANMESAEKAAARKAEAKADTPDKLFVQTITVPKQRTVKDAKDERKPTRGRKAERKN